MSRATYREAGEAMRAAIQRGLDADLTCREHRVLEAVLSFTATYSRVEDRISNRQIAEMTGIDPRHVRRGLQSLAEKGVIRREPGAALPGRGNVASLVSLVVGGDRLEPPQEGPGQASPEGAEPARSDPARGASVARGQNEAVGGANPDQEGGPIRADRGGRPRPASEKSPEEYPEKVPEKVAPSPAANGRKRDRLWDALMDACGVDTTAIPKSARGAYNRARGDLAAIDATPDDIHQRAQVFRARWPDASLTPTALARRWPECDPTQAPNYFAPGPRPRQVADHIERQQQLERWRQEEAQDAVDVEPRELER